MPSVAYPNDPRQGGPQPPQGPPPGPSFPHGPSGAYEAPQGPPGGQGPPPGHPQQGPPPGYPPQGPPPGYPPYGYPGVPGPAPEQRSAAPWLIVGGIVLALVLVAGVVLGGVWLYGGSGNGVAAGGGASETETFEGLSREHVDTGETVDYEQFPPVGGEHYGFWQNCGVYDEPVLTEAAVHSLEHGAVWITHDPGLDPAGVEALAAYHLSGSYVLVSPMEGLPSAVVASAWGAQLRTDDPRDPELGAFLREYEQSQESPEPGAPCTGAYDGTQAEFDAQGAGALEERMN
ncbi:hypothetical protein GCM10007079_02540 [Nocardiopsis terrae]|nr:hypothetical protein GCM10007079_02540 [Nocardiopsis terrae]